MILDRNEYISGGNITAGKNFATSSAPTSLPAQVQQATYVAPTYTPPPAFVAPTYTAPEKYTAPEYDENRITDLTQTQAAGTVRGLRSAMQKISGSRFDNPNVKRMTLRDALSGYGQGLQSAMSKASESARGLYNTEYGVKSEEGKINYNTAVQASQNKYQGELQGQLAQYQGALQGAQTQYQGALQGSQAQFAAEQNRYNTEYQTLWNDFNAQQNRALEQQKIDIAAQDSATKAASSAVLRPPKGLDAYGNARWYKEHGIV